MEIIVPDVQFQAIMPQIIVVTGSILVLLLGVIARGQGKLIGYLSFLTCLIAIADIAVIWNYDGMVLSGMLTINHFTHAFCLIILASAAIVSLLTVGFIDERKVGEFYSILLMTTFGMMIMASSTNLIIIFLGLETLSIGLYVLAGFNRARVRSLESAIKYFLLGAFASGFFLYGIALIYGTTGSMEISKVAEFIARFKVLDNPLMLAGIIMLMVGFGFKVALVPFHAWTPDVYQGVPAAVAAFISTGPKAAAFAAFLRVFDYGFASVHDEWVNALVWICILTMSIGNLVAIVQRDFKRMLAYSSIAHAGYVLMAIISAPTGGFDFSSSSVMFYLAVYSLMNLSAFGIAHIFESREGRNLNIEDYVGLGFKYPMMGIAMTVAMFSLAGIPLTGGFVGKFQIFSSAINAGFVTLAIVGVLNALVSVYYYLRVLVNMYFVKPESEESAETIKIPFPVSLALGISTIGILLTGIFPSILMDLF